MLTNIIFQNRLYCEVQLGSARILENSFQLKFVSNLNDGFEMTYFADEIEDVDAFYRELYQLLENASKNEKVLSESDLKMVCMKAVDYANS
jgi:hypothetical protein